jgi:hypothetical protein
MMFCYFGDYYNTRFGQTGKQTARQQASKIVCRHTPLFLLQARSAAGWIEDDKAAGGFPIGPF